ncbi:TonB-dependent receptor [Pedobacter arcticus]|uniref:TonB-dependent receptor n=1 Tax=Pedobacter arcticus TaxID=752140 RepID=UPI00030FDA1B|nr:TonB-dependent receptor [Pedobacter arcticus]
MKHFKLLLFFWIFFASKLVAQNHTIIKGIITDKQSKLPLPGVTVSINSLNPPKYTVTDADGRFRFVDVTVGRHNLEAAIIGYQKTVIAEVLLSSGKDLEINIELEEQLNSLSEVVVYSAKNKSALNPMASVSSRSFSVEETSRYAAALFDPARMAQSFAGVAAAEDDNNIVIRGNAPKSVLWRLEGIEIFNPNHFADEGAAGGAISMINSNVIGTSDFYTGGTPSEFGNTISGAFDLQFRKGNTDKSEYSLMLGVLGAATSLEGPFKKGGKSSYLFSYRYSSLALLDKIGLSLSDVGIPIYQDVSYNFVFPTKKVGTFSLFGIGGNSKVEDKAIRDHTKWKERNDYADQKFTFNSGNAGLKHVLILNDKMFLKNTVVYSKSQNTDKVDTLRQNYDTDIYSRNDYKNGAIRYSGQLNYNPNANNTIRSGVTASFLDYNLKGLEYNYQKQALNEVLNKKGNASSIDAYSQWKHNVSEQLSFNVGVHTNYFSYSSNFYVEPRLSLNWWVKPDQQISLGVGAYSRLEPLAYYFANDELTSSAYYSAKKLKPTRSAEVVLAYEKILGETLKFKAETYYQHLYKVPVSNNPNYNFSTINASSIGAIFATDYSPLVNQGTGRNYGLELTLERSLNKGYYFLITTSIFDSKYKNLAGKEFNTTFNSHIMGNFVAGKEWQAGKNGKNIFGVNGKVIYTGGRKYTPILLEASRARQEQVNDEKKVNTLTADPYFRVDFSSSYRINRAKVSHTFFIDAQNLLNRVNNLGYYYDLDTKNLKKNNLGGVIPVLNYRLEF